MAEAILFWAKIRFTVSVNLGLTRDSISKIVWTGAKYVPVLIGF
jgi:hypothetical protein